MLGRPCVAEQRSGRFRHFGFVPEPHSTDFRARLWLAEVGERRPDRGHAKG